jgi:Spy/CpxP family protein refolding chaperone
MHIDHATLRSRYRRAFSRRAYLRMGLMSGAVLVGLSAAGCGWGEGRRPHWGRYRHAWRDDPAAAKEHAQEMARWLLRSIDATEDQRARVNDIIAKLVDDVQPLASRHRANREALVTAFTSETVDRAELDRLRRDDLDLADKAYSRFAEAFADAAAVLTREQRVALAEAARHFRRWG